MKKLIRKILKESDDEFEWAHDLNTDDVEKRIKSGFRNVEYDFSFNGLELFQMLVDAGIKDAQTLQTIGDYLYRESQKVYDNGVDSGRESCDCDGCCDDYVWYETAEEEKEQAREEGYEDGKSEGIEEGRAESEEEIADLESKIEELENQLNESYNKKNYKRI